jgi:hypothetical protein
MPVRHHQRQRCTGKLTELQEMAKETKALSCLRGLVVEVLVGGVGLTELPPRRDDVEELNVLPAGGDHGEAEALADEPGESLPVGAPVPGHLDPPRAIALDPRGAHGAAAGEVLDVDEQEVVEAGDAEAHAALARAPDLLVDDGDDAGPVDTDVLPRRLRHVEVGAPRAAPAAVGQREVGRAQVGGRDRDRRAGLTVLAARARPVARDGVALPARRAVLEQGLAQRRVQHAVAGVVQVAVPAGATWTHESHQYEPSKIISCTGIGCKQGSLLPMVSEPSGPP